jgi:L-lactate dehydrogenase complex protein LldG
MGGAQSRGAAMTREAILGKVRSGLGATGSDGTRRAAVAQRLGQPQRHLVPARTKDKSPEQLAGLLRRALEEQSATVLEVASAEKIPGAIGAYLRSHNLPAHLRIGKDALLANLPWETEANLVVENGAARPTDEVAATHAVAGIAETGTLVLTSGAENPVTLNFLPETHVIVVAREDIVGPYEDAWDRLRSRFGARTMPRTVNLISGASCTADIGSMLVRGAHGPRRLCVIIVG